MTQYSNDSTSNELTVKELLYKVRNWMRYFLSKAKFIVLAGILGGLIGFGYAYIQKVNYSATLTFALEDEKSGSSSLGGGALGLASSLGFDLGASGGGAFSGANLIELIKSRRIVEQTLLDTVRYHNKTVSLAEVYINLNGWRDVWEKNNPAASRELQFPAGKKRENFSLQQDSLLGIIYRSLTGNNNLAVMQKDKKVSIINIEVNTRDELFSKLFAETIAREVSEFYIDTKSRKSKLNVEILERQADSIRRELNAAINGVATANDNTFNLNPSLNIQRTPSTRRQVDVQANTAILTELVKNLELAKVTLRKETPLIQIIDTPILPLPKVKASKLRYMITGGLVGGFLMLLILFFRRWWKQLALAD